MMKAVKGFADDIKELQECAGVDLFGNMIKNPLLFSLTVDCLGVGLSFRNAARVIMSTRERSAVATLGSFSDSKNGKFARFACAMDLQSISELFESAWTFFIAFDMSIRMITSYLNICLHLRHDDSSIINVYLM